MRVKLLLELSVIISAIDIVYGQFMESVLKEKYDGYGEDWFFMPDGDNKPQVAILKGEAIEWRGLVDESVNFRLYTREGPENGTLLFHGNADSIKKSTFDSSKPTKFITHGWKSSALASGPTNLKNAFLKKSDYNVILVDWEPLASSTFYLGPMQNTGKVGEQAGKFIDYLIEQTGAKPEDMHFIGHSLGAHVAGNAGSAVKSGKLGRISALDPALPGFHVLTDNNGKLDSSDALFVDVIHSCGGILGFLQPVGHADFYPNGGVAVQPGCCCMPEITEACSHGRAYVYFTESVLTDDGFIATKCDTWDQFESGACKDSPVVFMGDTVDRNARGSYFLRTRSEAPFVLKDQTNTKSLIPPDLSEDCDEPGGWVLDKDGFYICGNNEV